MNFIKLGSYAAVRLRIICNSIEIKKRSDTPSVSDRFFKYFLIKLSPDGRQISVHIFQFDRATNGLKFNRRFNANDLMERPNVF